jgi:hypothetical protein
MPSLLATQVLRGYKEDSFRDTRMADLLAPLSNNENPLLPCHTEYEYVKALHYFTVYRVFEKELYNFESLYTFIQRTCTVF